MAAGVARGNWNSYSRADAITPAELDLAPLHLQSSRMRYVRQDWVLIPGYEASGTVIRATEADLDVLSQVIADAFHDVAPSRWLITDPGARQQIFPGYFRSHA